MGTSQIQIFWLLRIFQFLEFGHVPSQALGDSILFLEPFARFWSHFCSIYCQKLTQSRLRVDF